jgi:hypothetical protein
LSFFAGAPTWRKINPREIVVQQNADKSHLRKEEEVCEPVFLWRWVVTVAKSGR